MCVPLEEIMSSFFPATDFIIRFIDMIWYDDVARSGRCAYMLGLSVKLCYMVEGTLFLVSHFI